MRRSERMSSMVRLWIVRSVTKCSVHVLGLPMMWSMMFSAAPAVSHYGNRAATSTYYCIRSTLLNHHLKANFRALREMSASSTSAACCTR